MWGGERPSTNLQGILDMAWIWTKEVATVAVLLAGSLTVTSLDLASATADPNERLKALVAAITAERTAVPPVLLRAAQISKTADETLPNTQPVRGPASVSAMNGGEIGGTRRAGTAIRCGDFFVLIDAVELRSIGAKWAADCHFGDWNPFPAELFSAGKEQLAPKSIAHRSDPERSGLSTAAAPIDIVTKSLAKPKGLSTGYAVDWP
nr:efflux RND transporter periplasmic adaptor subunit [Rhizobium sp. Q54]